MFVKLNGICRQLRVPRQLCSSSFEKDFSLLSLATNKRNNPQNFELKSKSMSLKSSKPNVYVTRGDLPGNIIKALSESCNVDMWSEGSVVPRNELLKNVVGKDALYCMLTDKIDSELLDAAGPKLQVVGTVSVGYDHINIEECRKRGVKVGYTPGVLTDATADLTLALLLATSRRLIEASKDVTSGGWTTWDPFYMCGKEISGSTIGIVGLGRIGQAVMKRLIPFGVKQFLYCGRNARSEDEAMGAKFVDFEYLLRESEFIVICCSLNESTKGLFDSSAFSKMKSNAILINTSRGLIVDQEALYDALKTGKIWAAGIDVTHPEPLPRDHPLTTLPNCVILPHIGSSTDTTRDKMAMMTVHNIVNALHGKEMLARLC